MVKGVEKFRPELDPEPLGNTEILQNADVPVVQSGPAEYTPATIPEETGCRVAEVCRVKPQNSVAAEISGRVDGIVADQVAITSMRIEAAVAGCVTSKDITPGSGLESGDGR